MIKLRCSATEWGDTMKYSDWMFRRLFAVFLSLCLLAGCLAGCTVEAPQTEPTTCLTEERQGESEELTSAEEVLKPTQTSQEKEDSSEEEKPKPSEKEDSSSVGNGEKVSLSQIPAYSGSPFTVLQNNIPNFTAEELKSVGYETYYNLDVLGRTVGAVASVGKDTMPSQGEERGSISSIKPSGWIQASYDSISGKYLYNRCHLIGWQLSAENANPKNLMTGTKYFNVDGMLPFENMVADYIKETGNHVAYRITPLYQGNNLVATGVQMEAWSVEDQGEGICFHVFCYNVQPGITINYTDGSSTLASASPATTAKVTTTTKKATTTTKKVTTTTKKVTTTTTAAQKPAAKTYVLNTNTKKFHYPDCHSVKQIAQKNYAESDSSRESLISQGYSPCGNCHP